MFFSSLPPCLHYTQKIMKPVKYRRQTPVSSTATLRQHLLCGKSVLLMVDSPQLDLLQFCLSTCSISINPLPSLFIILGISLIIVHLWYILLIRLPPYFLLWTKGHIQEMNLTFKALSIPVPQVYINIR